MINDWNTQYLIQKNTYKKKHIIWQCEAAQKPSCTIADHRIFWMEFWKHKAMKRSINTIQVENNHELHDKVKERAPRK